MFPDDGESYPRSLSPEGYQSTLCLTSAVRLHACLNDFNRSTLILYSFFVFLKNKKKVKGDNPRTVKGNNPRTFKGNNPRTVKGNNPRTVRASKQQHKGATTQEL